MTIYMLVMFIGILRTEENLDVAFGVYVLCC